MANDTLNEPAPVETTTPPARAPAASPSAAKPATSSPARRKKAAAKTRPRSTAKRSKAAKRRSASRPQEQASIAPPAPARATAGRTGLGATVADLVETNARPYASAQEQLASATRGTWIAPVAELNGRAITRVAAAQADLARRLLG